MSYIILKFDDLKENTTEAFQKVNDHCMRYSVPVSFGLIGSSLENPSESYIGSLKRMKQEGVELWNHGYYHTEAEFSKNYYENQKESILSTQMLMKKHLGEVASTFGSPHNNSTEKTVAVLRGSFPEITFTAHPRQAPIPHPILSSKEI